MYTATIGGFDYTFDFEDKRIDVDEALASVDVINLYAAIKEAQASLMGIAYPRVANAAGLDTLNPGIKTFLTVTLLSTWEINSLQSSGQFSIKGGNIIRADGADPFRDNPLLTYINNLSQAGVLAETGTSGLTPSESADLAAIDTVAANVTALQALNAAMDAKIDALQTINATIDAKLDALTAASATADTKIAELHQPNGLLEGTPAETDGRTFRRSGDVNVDMSQESGFVRMTRNDP